MGKFINVLEMQLGQFDALLAPELEALSGFIANTAHQPYAQQCSQLLADLINPSDAAFKISPDTAWAKWFVKLLHNHPAYTRPSLFSTDSKIKIYKADPGNDTGAAFNREATAIMSLGSLALGLAADSSVKFISPLFFTSIGCDVISIAIRTMLLHPGKDIDPKKPRLGNRIPIKDLNEIANCRNDLTKAMSGLAAAASSIAGHQKIPQTHANGIQSIGHYAGTCREEIHIFGAFPVSQPPGVEIIFPTPEGTWLPVQAKWTSVEIVASPHFSIGEGPVGFQEGVATFASDFEAASTYSDMLASCFGIPGRGIGVRITDIVASQVSTSIPPPPILPNNVNIIYGGPICTVKPRFNIQENSVISIEGKRFAPGDQIVVGETVCPTTFVSTSILTATVAGLGITGGEKRVVVRRNICESNSPCSVFFESTLIAGQMLRCRPWERVYISGFGFEPNRMMARINGQHAQVTCTNANSLAIDTFRPTATPPKLVNRDAEESVIEIFQEARSIGTAKLLFDVFRVAFFGDSVVWGQGLPENQKFSALLDLNVFKTGDLRAVVALDRAAHSGATILEDLSNPDPASFDVSECIFDIGGPLSLAGEVPLSAPSITAQINAWSQKNERNNIDLVVMDGGINDVSITTILNPIESDAGLVLKTNQFCNFALQGLIAQTLVIFPNAKIIVTGYYQIVSVETNWFLFLEATAPLLGLGLAAVGPVHMRLEYRSRLFRDTAHAAMRQAIQTVDPSGQRVRFADPGFAPENAIWASNTFLWGTPTDPFLLERTKLCSKMGGDLKCPVASIGHPNALGAQAYAKAICKVLEI